MILIDPPLVPWRGKLWSHLVSDTSYEELHAFAATMGIPERAFQRDHYDVPQDYYEAIIAAGAVSVAPREIVRRLHEAGLRQRKAPAHKPIRLDEISSPPTPASD
ncbi:MAG: DUF4031 domain-containing protein [Nocardioidaceae bacterium]|nr:MAG: DUF4031 domain-containing protein [Nocardioidaceae bacterium]